MTQHIVMLVIHDKCGSLLVNAGELACMPKSNIYYWPMLPKANVKNDKYNIKLSNPPTWRSCFEAINVEALIKDLTVNCKTYG